jgi:hypothetical protein
MNTESGADASLTLMGRDRGWGGVARTHGAEEPLGTELALPLARCPKMSHGPPGKKPETAWIRVEGH